MALNVDVKKFNSDHRYGRVNPLKKKYWVMIRRFYQKFNLKIIIKKCLQ